ncbi:hypothetical protein V1511DRAFT_494541 [Dipodascopsis uninucleata]
MGTSISSEADEQTELQRSIQRIKLQQAATPKLPLVKVHELLRGNYATYAVLYNDRKSCNCMPQLLGAAYILGATSDQLVDLYEVVSKDLEIWKEDSPSEVTQDDWRSFYGDREYQRGYKDFFDEELVTETNYDWKKVSFRYLLLDDAKLLNGLIGALGQPMMHMAYAFELDSPEIALEALTLVASTYPSYSHYIDTYVKNYPNLLSSGNLRYLENDALVILNNMRDSKEIESLGSLEGNDLDFDRLFDQYSETILKYFYKLNTSDPQKILEDLFHLSSVLLMSSFKNSSKFDLSLLYTLTFAHACHVLSMNFTSTNKVSLASSLWLFMVLSYLSAKMPKILTVPEELTSESSDNATWNEVTRFALASPQRYNVPYLTALRAFKSLSSVRQENDEFYLKGADIFTRKAGTFTIYGKSQ